MAVLLSFSLIMIVLLRDGIATGYDPTERIYPWPLPADRKPIFFSLIVSFGETFNSSGVVPGVNVALDIINSNESNLLDGYSLHYILSDSQVSFKLGSLNVRLSSKSESVIPTWTYQYYMQYITAGVYLASNSIINDTLTLSFSLSPYLVYIVFKDHCFGRFLSTNSF